MVLKNSCNDIVIFLGAGFTHDLELPIMSNFGSESDRVYKGVNDKGNDKKDAAPIFRKAGDMFKKFQNYSSKISKLMNININNMEDLFCLADIIKGTSIDRNLTIPEVDNLEINKIITNIRLWLWKIFHQCPPMNNARQTAQKNEAVYKDFFRFIVEKHQKYKNIKIITTNYDLMPEYLLNELKQRCTYRISCDPGEWKVDLNSTDKFAYINCNNCIPIYKLHGSVNYFFNDEKDQDNINIVTDILNVDKVRQSCAKVFKDKPSLFPWDAIIELKEKQNNNNIPIPAIIPPMYSKIESMGWLKCIWNNSLMAIRNAKIIVFIGYSFPQSDGFMKSFFQSALIGRNNQEPPIIINLDKNKDIKCTYCEIFNNINNENFLTGTFSEKCSDLINLMDSRIKA